MGIDPTQQFFLKVVANHPWVIMGYEPIEQEL
jgi:hypothetical protein